MLPGNKYLLVVRIVLARVVHPVLDTKFIDTKTDSKAYYCRAPDKVRILFRSIMFISSPNPMFDHLLESSHRF